MRVSVYVPLERSANEKMCIKTRYVLWGQMSLDRRRLDVEMSSKKMFDVDGETWDDRYWLAGSIVKRGFLDGASCVCEGATSEGKGPDRQEAARYPGVVEQ